MDRPYISTIAAVFLLASADWTAAVGHTRRDDLHYHGHNLIYSAVEDFDHATGNQSVCGQKLADFGVSVSSYINCAALHARPFTMCENCEIFYEQVSFGYQQLKSSVENDSSRCEDLILNADKVRVVEQLNTFAIQLWAQSQCSDCFSQTVDASGRSVNVLSNDTVAFNELMNETLACIRNTTNMTDAGDIDDFYLAGGNVSVACRLCSKQYERLNQLYNRLADPTEGLCMDIIDKMNMSRTLWSTKLECVHRTNPTLYLFVSSGIVSGLPFLFYLVTWWLADRQEHSIAPQKRLTTGPGSSNS